MKKKQRQDINQIADKFINYFKTQDQQKQEGENELWNLIAAEIGKHEVKSRRRKISYWIGASMATAASVLFFIYISNIFHTKDYSRLENYVSQLSSEIENGDQVQLLLSDHEKVNMDKDSVGIIYSSNGTIQIDKDLYQESHKNDKEIEEEFNQIIVPRGKYIFITLSDGTKMHVNSGTRVVYPRFFTGIKREIYVDGEIFLDVAKNPQKPFIVKTSNFNIEVTGTSFNVNAYKEDSRGEVVLVEGSVRLNDQYKNKIILKPNQSVSIVHGKAGETQNVCAADYTAWINGLLISHSETLEVVFKKLYRFYNIPVVISPAVRSELVNGKLDLRLPLSELIRLMAVAVPIKYQERNGTYYIEPKEK